MSRIISTSTHPIGYWVSLPEHIEEAWGSHFENLTKLQQYTLLATLTFYMAEEQFILYDTGEDSTYELFGAYMQVEGTLPEQTANLLEEIEQLNRQRDGIIVALVEALICNIRCTHIEEEAVA